MFYKNLKIKSEDNEYNFLFDQKNITTDNISVDKIEKTERISWLSLKDKIIQKDPTLITEYSNGLAITKITANSFNITQNSVNTLWIKAKSYILPASWTANYISLKNLNKLIVKSGYPSSSVDNTLKFSKVDKLYYNSNRNIKLLEKQMYIDDSMQEHSETIELDSSNFERLIKVEVYEKKKNDNSYSQKKMISFIYTGKEKTISIHWNRETPSAIVCPYVQIANGENSITISEGVNGEWLARYFYKNNYYYLIIFYLVQIY